MPVSREKKRKRAKHPLKCQAPDCLTSAKRSFYSEDSARFFMTRYMAKRVYLCPDCGFWHLTNRETWIPTEEFEASVGIRSEEPVEGEPNEERTRAGNGDD